MSASTAVPAWPADFLATLAADRRAFAFPLDLRPAGERFGGDVLALLFPHFAAGRRSDPADVAMDAAGVADDLRRLLHAPALTPPQGAEAATAAFCAALPTVRAALLADAEAIHRGDPAAHSLDEVIVAYPGFLAVATHRIAHLLVQLGVPLLPRILAETAHRATGIDIHPSATIGTGFAIDHGTGIVIGETAHIGDRVKIYQGVTLGALSVSKRLASQKRHPTIEDDVVIYANATILGGQTVVGRGSVIGGNVWLTKSVPPRSVVTHSSDVVTRDDDDGIEYHI